MAIHPTALVDPGAQLGADVEILPFTIVEADTVIGDRCVIGPHALIRKWTEMGADCHIAAGAVLGEAPQDRKYAGEQTFLRIGDRNEIREYVTLHRATGEGNATVVGDDNLLMAYCHAGHNCHLGSHISMANQTQLSGHTVIEDYVIIGGMTGFHQFVTVGRMAMVGAMSRIATDAPPFCVVEGNPAEVRGVNVIGLERRGVEADGRNAMRKAFRLLFRAGLNTSDALEAVAAEVPDTPEVRYLCEFQRRVQQGSLGRQLGRR